ncbi:MAG: translation initiation factor IF-2, partial [Patescibacteria group bacterium]
QTGSERSTVVSVEQHEEEGTTNKKTLNLLIKADVLGSLEAIINSLSKIKHDEVGVKIIGKGLGNITENDVTKAEAGAAILIGFNVSPTTATELLLKEKNLTFLQYKVIYDLINWVKEELEKMLDKEKIITELGSGLALAVFRREKNFTIVGVKVLGGKVVKDCLARIKRGGLLINTGKIAMCKIGQQEVKDVIEGTECGVQLETREKIEIDDELEFYHEETKTRKIIFQ